MSNSENRSDLIRWQQDLDEELIFLIQSLTGKKLTHTGWVSVEGSSAMCNNKFIEEVIIPQCKPFLSKNMINTNFDTKNIYTVLRNTCNEIADAMADNFDVYDIEFNNFDLIMRNIKNTIRPSVFRALNGWTKKTDSSSIKRVEAARESIDLQRGGKNFFENMFAK